MLMLKKEMNRLPQLMVFLFSKDKTQLIYYQVKKNDESYKTPKETKELASYSFNKNSYLKKLELNEGLEKKSVLLHLRMRLNLKKLAYQIV